MCACVCVCGGGVLAAALERSLPNAHGMNPFRAGTSPSQIGTDHKRSEQWVRSVEDNAWIRIHRNPRHTMFTPMSTRNDPPKESLSKVRLSVITFTSDPTGKSAMHIDENESIMVDDWTISSMAHRRIG